MTFLDLMDQIVVTEFVKREYNQLVRGAGGGLDQRTSYGARILPTERIDGRHVRVRYQDILGTGLAQFKAPGATPALWTHKRNLRERFMELVDIDEFHRIDPIDMLQLKSPDPNVIKEAQWSLADRATAMMERNDLRTEWMRWEALKGVLVVPYPNAAPITINYGIPAPHFPTFATPWTNVALSDPIENLWALGAVALTAAGIYLGAHHMSEETYRYMVRSEKVKQQLSSYGRDLLIPRDKDIVELLRDGSTITRTDDGYMTENQTTKKLNKWIGDGKIFTTTPDFRYAGRRIGTLKDGWVLVGSSTTADQPVAKQGVQSEWVYNRIGQQTLLRVASARMPVLNSPEALAWGTAYVPA